MINKYDDDELAAAWTQWRDTVSEVWQLLAMETSAVLQAFYLALTYNQHGRIKAPANLHSAKLNKKLCYRRRTARRNVSAKSLPTAAQQCRNKLYNKSK